MNILKRVGFGAAGLMAAGAMMAPAALADVTCTISGNGANSHNRCNITVNTGGCKKIKCASGSSQTNNASVSNTVTVSSSTGGNKANKNTGGDVSITTGDSNVDISITNNVNSNSQ